MTDAQGSCCHLTRRFGSVAAVDDQTLALRSCEI
jgi:hypothetical protein